MQDFSTISIVLSADENYLWHLVETIWSIRRVTKDRKTNLYVLLDCNSERSFNDIGTEIMMFSTKMLEVIPIDINKACFFDKSKMSTTKFISAASYARIFLPEIFTGLDKILWLDCDLLVRKPLDEFWDVDVTGQYAAAIDDFTMEQSIKIELDECKVKRYFNAGVMLFNLKMIRSRKVNRLCKDRMYGTKPRFQDQTVLNSTYGEHVVWLSPRFNLHYTSYTNPKFNEWAFETWGESYGRGVEDPTIVHYTGIGTKPWDRPTPFYFDDYIENASMARDFVLSCHPCMFGRIRDALMRIEERVRFRPVKSRSHIPSVIGRKVNVCLTSYQRRIDTVGQVIRNLLNQSIPPDNVYLTLSREEFPRGLRQLPSDIMTLAESSKLKVVWTTKNTKTMKKLFHALQYMDGGDLCLLVDDDMFVPHDFIEARLEDFYKFGEKVGVSSNDGLERLVGCVVSGAGSLMSKDMLDGWDNFMTEDVVATYEDDWAYMFIMRLNHRFFAAASMYQKSMYRYMDYEPSSCYNTRRTLSVMGRRYKSIRSERNSKKKKTEE